jgi:predicted chitinase
MNFNWQEKGCRAGGMSKEKLRRIINGGKH